MAKGIKFDFSKLKGLIREKGYTQEEIAKIIGINPATLSIKISGQGFRQSEIRTMALILGITFDEIGEYFFTQKV
jgi:transcriptional regulator with XRE-family HTH domain